MSTKHRHHLLFYPFFKTLLVAACLAVDPDKLKEKSFFGSTVIQVDGLPTEKQIIADCLYKFNKTYYIIEMQNDVKKYFYKRIGFYGHAASVQVFKAGQSYDTFPNIISIVFLGKSYFPGNEPFFYDMSILELIKRASGIPVIYCQLPKLKVNMETATLTELALSFLNIKTHEDMYKIRDRWKVLCAGKQGKHDMDKLVAEVERAQSESNLLTKLDNYFGTSKLEKQNEELKAKLKAERKERKAKDEELKAKDEELKAKLKAERKERKELEAKLARQEEFMARLMDQFAAKPR